MHTPDLRTALRCASRRVRAAQVAGLLLIGQARPQRVQHVVQLLARRAAAVGAADIITITTRRGGSLRAAGVRALFEVHHPPGAQRGHEPLRPGQATEGGQQGVPQALLPSPGLASSRATALPLHPSSQ